MKKINAAEFKTKCLAILDHVSETGESILVLKRGKPVAQLIPPVVSESKYAQTALRGSVKILGDVVEPALPPEAWEVLEGDA